MWAIWCQGAALACKTSSSQWITASYYSYNSHSCIGLQNKTKQKIMRNCRMFEKKSPKTEQEVKPCGASSLLPRIESHIPQFRLFTVTLTTFDPDLQWKREECMGRVNEKEGREEWMTERREGKGGGEECNKAILSGFSCDWWDEMLKCLSSPFPSSPLPRFLPPLPFPKNIPKTIALPKYYCRNKSCVFPKHQREKSPKYL